MKTYTRCSTKGKSKHSCNSKFTKKKQKKLKAYLDALMTFLLKIHK